MKYLKTNFLQIERIVAVIAIMVATFFLCKDYVAFTQATSAVEGDVDLYAPNAFKTFIILLGFMGVLLGAFLKHPFGFLISLCSIACPLYIFIKWYIDSFLLIRNENAGWEAKVNKAGLAGAEWEHIIMLFLTLLLLTSLTLRLMKRLYSTSNSSG